MSDENTFTEVSQEGLGGNIGNAFGKALTGIILLLVGLAGLFWNEGNYIKTAKALEEAQEKLVLVTDITSVDPAHDGQVVYMTGEAKTDETLTDPLFAIEAPALNLTRKVQFYQWKEESKKEEKKKMGGGTETTTTYTYKKVWTDSPISSSNFHQKDYVNSVALPNCEELFVTPNKVNFGAFTLSKSQINRIDNKKDFSLANYTLPANLAQQSEIQGNTITVRSKIADKASTTEAQIGDMQISWQVTDPSADISIIAQQTAKSFSPYAASSDRNVDLLGMGTQSHQQLFGKAKDDNNLMLWILRLIGIIVVCLGCTMLTAPFEVIVNIVPFLGGMVGFLSKGVAILVGIMLSLIDIAIAWFFYRPFITLLCLIPITGIIYLLKMRRKCELQH